MKVYRGIKQGTPEWFMARLGKPTASEFDRIITPSKGELSSGADAYINELIGERIMNCPPDDVEAYTSRAMRHGIATEPQAINAYAFDCNTDVERVGFCETDDGFAGCSPDGLVGDDGGVEGKCPQPKKHVAYMRDPSLLLADYRCQVHGSLWVTGRKWWDIFSYLPWGGAPMVVVRVVPDEFTEKLAKAMADFRDKYEAAWAEIEPQLTAAPAIDMEVPF